MDDYNEVLKNKLAKIIGKNKIKIKKMKNIIKW